MTQIFRSLLALSSITLVGIIAYAQESANVTANINDSLYWDNQLDQIVVTATRTPKSVAKVPILTRIITNHLVL